MTSPFSSPIVFALVVLLSFLVLARLVSAQTGTSTNFIAKQSVNDFGGDAASSSFQLISTGGQVVSGQSTSTNFTLDAGFEYLDSFSPKTQNWRWYDDESNETPTAALEDENVAPIDIQNDSIIKLRIAVAETGGYGVSNVKFRLQYATTSDFSSGAYMLAEKTDCIFSSIWCYGDGVDGDGDIVSTKLLSDADACSGGVGNGCGTHNENGTTTSSLTHVANAVTEYEFTVRAAGIPSATTYFFRLYDVGAQIGVPTNTGESYPSLVTGGGSLSFSITGIEAASSTSGITTDVDTSATEVSFGALPIGTPLHAAQRLSVSTNASTGYTVFAFGSQGFLGEQSDEISPVTGTNDAPSAWNTGCILAAIGCFGYHTSESVLGTGNTTRFAADDTYASFTQTLKEVAFSANPVESENTDIVYKVLARDLQDSGAYSTNVTYIVVPVF